MKSSPVILIRVSTYVHETTNQELFVKGDVRGPNSAALC